MDIANVGVDDAIFSYYYGPDSACFEANLLDKRYTATAPT